MIPQAASMFWFGFLWICWTFAFSVGYSFAVVKTLSYLQLSWFFHGMYAMTCRYYTAFDAKSFRVGCLCMFFKVSRQHAQVFSNADWFGVETSHARFCASKAWAQWSRENLRKVLERSFNTPWRRSHSLSNLGNKIQTEPFCGLILSEQVVWGDPSFWVSRCKRSEHLCRSVGHVHSDAFAEKWQVREVKDGTVDVQIWSLHNGPANNFAESCRQGVELDQVHWCSLAWNID